MHKDEIVIDEFIVDSLIREQFPQFSEESAKKVETTGTVNATYLAVYRWLPGEPCGVSPVNETETAKSLAQFVNELRSIPVSDTAHKAGRKPLRELDEKICAVVSECKTDIGGGKVLTLWRELIETEAWDGKPVWIHAVLLKPNLLVNGGRLTAVIDFGGAGIGDPAFDITPAWTCPDL